MVNPHLQHPSTSWAPHRAIHICGLQFVDDHLKEANQLVVPYHQLHVPMPEATNSLSTELAYHLCPHSQDFGPQCGILQACREGEQKRKTNQASSFRAPPEATVEEDEDTFRDNFEIEDKLRGEGLAAREEAT